MALASLHVDVTHWKLPALLVAGVIVYGCGGEQAETSTTAGGASVRPSILLVTLDTTRADAVGPDAAGVQTPAFNALVARGRRFTQAYTTAPETLPAHSSIMTGLYPGGHGVHENARPLGANHAVLAEQLQQAGYRTAAFVSSFVLARRFGLARGFEVYDDELPAQRVERTSAATTDRALAYLARAGDEPLFLWVHYFDPHTPYAPPEPFRTTYAGKPYHGEVAAMDQQLGRLVHAFERHAAAPVAIAVTSDHGEGLGDHGELQHGHLLYQSTMKVPLVLVGPGIEPSVGDAPVSTRRLFHTLLDWAGQDASDSLRRAGPEVVLGEAMKPFLSYGWQPQVMAVQGRQKAILAGSVELYDVIADPAEAHDLGSGANLPAPARKALHDYPVPAPDAARVPDALGAGARRDLASLGYVSASTPPLVRKNAPRPADMTHLFEPLERASGLFVQERYKEVIPLLQRILTADPFNLDATLRLATAYSSLGQDALAVETFERATAIAPRSPDVRVYLALHYARGTDWTRATPMLEQIVKDSPDRLPAVEALAVIRQREGRLADAVSLRQKIYSMRDPSPGELAQLGEIAMAAEQTSVAIDAFEKARAARGAAFAHHLELGVLYLAAGRLDAARTALDRVPASHPAYSMALFKRAQVSVLLNEPDRGTRIEQARQGADRVTRPLIENERLFLAIPR